MALVSPGVQVTVIDQSQYLPTATNSVPLLLVASATNKANSAGTAVAADTMTSKTWTELTTYTVGGSAVRGTAVFAASTSSGTTPSNVTTSTATAITYTMTGSATVYGCFLVTGTGAVSTISSTAGTLYSEGNFSTAKTVTSGDTVTVTYSTTATS